MNRSLSLLVALFTLMLGGYFAANTEPISDTLIIQTAVVHLAEPLSIRQILKEVADYDVELVAFHCQRRIKDRVITDGYFLTSEDKETLDSNALQERYWLSYGAMLQDLYRDMEISKSEIESDVAWQHYVEQINGIRRNFSSINDRIEFSQTKDESYYLASTPTPNATPAPYDLWVPSRGSIHVQPSVIPGERFVRNRVSWDSATRLSAFGSTSTYEHDFFLNDSDSSMYGPGTYLSDAQDIVGIPIVSHWSSSFLIGPVTCHNLIWIPVLPTKTL